MAALQPAELNRLYRQMLRAAGSITDYNFRSYFQRRSREDFRVFASRWHRGEADVSAQEEFMREGQTKLEMLKRQGALSQLYKAAPLRSIR
mmetsp:Transcript_22724/g.58110  ORF Transcript_22724/g.58110 Transcript_22724/m.58110 type:complete len:91 (+) Transcript_22724:72-344(+)